MDLLAAAEVEDVDGSGEDSSAQGVVTGDGRDFNSFATTFMEAIKKHQHFDRDVG